MLSTRRQKAKARKSREMDVRSDFGNMDVTLGSSNVNSNERELSNVIGNSESHCDIESISQPRGDDSRENVFGHYVHENIIPRQDNFQETIETFTSELNMRLSRDGLFEVHDAQSNK